MRVEQFGDRWICIEGVGKMFYQDGFPLGLSVSRLKEKGIETSMFHVIEELWGNGWSWKTIEMKLRGEMEDDDNELKLDINSLMEFYACLEQPMRANGGYEKSREMIFQYLFGHSSKEAIENKEVIEKLHQLTELKK